jgi:hypothetical protein
MPLAEQSPCQHRKGFHHEARRKSASRKKLPLTFWSKDVAPFRENEGRRRIAILRREAAQVARRKRPKTSEPFRLERKGSAT